MPQTSIQNRKLTSHTKDLALLFAIPLAIVALAVAIIYTPRLLANPNSDFIYSVCDSYDCEDLYEVSEQGYLEKIPATLNEREREGSTLKLRYYDASEDSSRNITYVEALTYRLQDSTKSPDGYSLSRGSSDGGFLLWGDYDDGWYLTSGMKSKKVVLTTNDNYYSRDINFKGWVEK